ncbi:DUF2188 domain-containing protein [Thalassoroseus pseudoceratinae]|uniref:DUF2188 domain-containing protein n=1 Tax=Thalassoroseus pseudoceratinae TaxID=2713176 RepID=UPI00197F4496|nr:DUF2188 domain-containing protein [Thalassoroseus pseudoceratinae]
MSANLHIVTHEDGWAVKEEGKSDAVSTHSTQKEAVEQAVSSANGDANIVIHGRDGRIRDVKSPDNGNGNVRSQSAARTVATGVSSLGTRIRWGAVLAGFFVTVAASITLTVLGFALSLCLANVFGADGLRTFVGAWVSITTLASLFVGGLTISQLTVGESDYLEPSIYGVILWALTIVMLPLLPMSAVNMGFGSVATTNNSPGIELDDAALSEAGLNDEQAETVQKMVSQSDSPSTWITGNATEIAWLTFAALVLSLGAAIFGSITGAGLSEDFHDRRVAAA